MQGKITLLFLLLIGAVLAGGCTGGDQDGTTPEPTSVPETTAEPSPTVGAIEQPVPTPPGDWGGDSPYEVGFVDPSTYHIPTPTPTVGMTRPPDDLYLVDSSGGWGSDTDPSRMRPYMNISAANASGVMTSDIFYIPFLYWRINATVLAHNAEYSTFKMEIMDANDPSREVGEIQMWASDFAGNGTEQTYTHSEDLLFREGYKEYYLVIRPSSIRSFDIRIEGPAKYMI
ncbi:hypothetical protein [Methanofollis fontis]|uniref:Uncharacterized protein n=1 Tax=Methanofollis fontis TaxID=2052832 RepID=A0A483CTK5_9EURY|nr:hypothetical protein [Methanofollis fontis]TAJ45714.1 hypothetical protein CUJ86_03100 [Methanofollis fontis]